jgi:hypothetical protein
VSRTVPAVLTVTLFTAASCSWAAGQAATSPRVTFTPATTVSAPSFPSAPSAPSETEPGPNRHSTSGLEQPEPEEQRLDLYGNDVSDAIANYKSDRTGSVYEEHSPQTEVPRLKHSTT